MGFHVAVAVCVLSKLRIENVDGWNEGISCESFTGVPEQLWLGGRTWLHARKPILHRLIF